MNATSSKINLITFSVITGKKGLTRARILHELYKQNTSCTPNAADYTSSVEKFILSHWGIGEDDALFDQVHDIAVEFTKNARSKYERVHRKINRILQTDENGQTLPEVLPTNKNRGNFTFSSIFDFTKSIYSGQ
jgi:hypothetical protein